VAILVGLAQLGPASTVGLPAAVAMAIAGTVAVVFGTLDGALLALTGAAAFGLAGGWAPGKLAALGLWPAIAAAVGWFARQVESERRVFGSAMTAYEQERKLLALELHDDTAQTLAAALMSLRSADRLADPERSALASANARDLIESALLALRERAVELRPKVLDDFGLVSAAEQLASRVAERSGVSVAVDGKDVDRLAGEVELVFFRIIEEGLELAVGGGAQKVKVLLERKPRRASLSIEAAGSNPLPGDADAKLRALREQVRLLGGRLALHSDGPGLTTLRAEVPC
jgi:signal transduction histidine kinase